MSSVPEAVLPGGVIRFNMPRTDLHVTINDTEVKPGLALGAWAAFHHVSANDAMVMGDLVLTDDEVSPVMKALQQGGVEVTALHNHLVGDSPKIMYVHMGGHGDPVRLAQTINQAVGLTKTPRPQSGGVLDFNVPRAEKVTHGGMITPPSLGAGTAINFQPTGDARAAIAGDAMNGERSRTRHEDAPRQRVFTR